MIRRSAPLSRPCHPCGLDLRPTRGPVIELEGRAKHALETGRTRLVAAGLGFALAFFILAWRLVDLGLGGSVAEPGIAETTTAPLATGRADIVDRNGVVLATTLPTASLYADARLVPNPAEAAAALAAVLPDTKEAQLREKLVSGKSFVWLERQLSPREQYEVNRLGIPGLSFQREMTRIYPQGALTAHIVGFTNVDNRGLAGIEQAFDEQLRGRTEPLALSIDLRVQDLVAEELARGVARFEAIGGVGMVLDLQTGELLASVSLPTYDPLKPAAAGDDARFNRATLGSYEMGSTFKIFTAAMALEAGTVQLTGGYDASKPLKVGRFTIEDFKGKHRWLSVPEIIIYSSNIGAAQMGRDVGTERQQFYLEALGLTRKPEIELPEVAAPQVPSPWRDINTLTIAFGHGIAVSPLQLVTAVGATLNGGIFRASTFLKNENGTPGVRILSEETSADIRWLLRLNALAGSGKKADVAGYLVGGKTGTAEKLTGGHYAKDKRVASFVGAFPMDAPRYLVLVMVDEPKPQADTGAWATGSVVAAPITGEIIARLGPLLGVAPVAPEVAVVTDEALIPILAKAKWGGGRTLASN